MTLFRIRLGRLKSLILVSALLAGWYASAQPYGLNQGTAIGPFLNGVFSNTAPNTTTTFDVEVAFTNLSFNLAMHMVPYPNTNWLVLIEHAGTIRMFPNRRNVTQGEVATFLDISGRVFNNSDSGATGIAFHPEFGQPGSTNRGYVYVTYKWRPSIPASDPNFAYIRLSRFTVPDGQMAADPNSELILVQEFDQQQFHDCGHLMFAPDTFLYFGVGDEGGANDEYNVTQQIDQRLHSGIFRIDVNQNPALSHPIIRQPIHHPNMPVGWPESFTTNYYIPNSNPFVNPNGSVLEEYYALGLRNPYRFNRDPVTGMIWIGDVGQATMEEVDILRPGRNYQWAYGEGTVPGPKTKPASIIGIEQSPLWAYGRNDGGCVIGGLVYRGVEFASALTGKYLCVDNVSGAIWALVSSNGIDLTSVEHIATMPPGSVYAGTSSCGWDANGEIYFLKVGGTGGGRIFKLKGITTVVPDPPALLSQLGAFTNLSTLSPGPGFHPYTVNAPLWSDGAAKKRWLGVPNDGVHNSVSEQIVFSPTNSWSFPTGTVFIKHFDLPINDTNSAVVKRLETRFLVMDGSGGAYGLTYKWRVDESDADLLTTSATQNYQVTTAGGGVRTQTWYFPSRDDCMSCHTANAGYVLGVRTHQMNCPTTYPETGVTDNQLRALGHIGLLGTNYSEAQLANYLKSYAIGDNSAPVQERVRSYIDANCSQCHRPTGAYTYFDARYTTPLADQGIIRGPSILFLNSTNDRVVVPQNIPASLMHNRANRVGQYQMPPLAKNVIDTNAVQLLANWISSLPTGPTLTFTGPGNIVNGPFLVSIQFSAPVTGLATNDFQVVNGSITGLSGSGANYTITVAPTSFGLVTVKLPAGQVVDGSSQGNYESPTLAVNFSNIPAGLVHRWSFSDTTDSVGGVTASLVGTATISGGKLNLPGGGVFANYASVNITNTLAQNPTISVETWMRMSSIGTWSKVWMFGQDTGGENSLSYVNFTPQTAGGYPKADFDTAIGPELNTTAAPNPPGMQANTDYHVVTVFDSGSDTMSIYINGQLADSASMGGGNITQLNANTARFGCGFFYGDPDFAGTIDELRIWNVALSSGTISNSFASGPNNLPTPGYVPPVISSIADVTIITNTSTGPIAFTVSPGTIPFAGISMSASSSNQTLVPNANIVLSGSGSNRTVTITPAPNQKGKTTITVSAFDGSSTVNRSFQLAVNIVPPQPILLHRWTFNTNGNDLVGAANATLLGSATISGGQLQLPGGAARVNCATVNLTNTFSTNASVSIESWFTVTTMQDWSKVWMFGHNTGSEPSLCNLSFTPRIGSAGNFPKIEINPPTQGEINTIGGPSDPGLMSAGTQYHVVTVYDAYNDTMSFYINGVLADSAGMGGFNITQLTINECYFGAPVFYSDPNLIGSINEMRIWNGPLSPARIVQNYNLGPDNISNGPTITVPPTNQVVNVGDTVNFSVGVSGAGPFGYQWRLGGVNLAGATSSLLSINDAQPGDAGDYTVVVTNSMGSATSVAATLTVNNPWLNAGLLHRWSFNDGTDSIGGANATLAGIASYSGGQLQLPGGGTFANYASVNIGQTLATHPSLSVESWFTINTLGNWSKLWMFGRDNAGGEPVLSYINFTPRTGLAANPPKVDFDTATAGELNTTGGVNPPAMTTATQYHVVVTFDSANSLMSFYINGALADSATMGGANITNLQANLARFGAGFFYTDPDFAGSINELRIWDGPLTANQVSTNLAAGPDLLPTYPAPRPLISSFGIAPGQLIKLGGTGVFGRSYVLQMKTNLGSSNWTTLATNVVGGNALFQFQDSVGADRQRFYRVVVP